MSQVKLLKIDTDGVPVEMNTAADDITLNSFTVQGGGPVLGTSGLDLNNQDISDIKNVSFNNSATATIAVNSTTFLADDLMFQTKENSIALGAAVLFPTVTDAGNNIDAFRLPTLGANPTASPTDGGEGYLIWQSASDTLFAWDGAAWKDLSIAEQAERVANIYTAEEALALGDCLYISSADNVSKADVSGAGAPSRVMGLAKAAALITAPVTVVCQGPLEGLSGMTAGARYYADPATPGGKTTTLPVGSGNTIVQLGYAKSATVLHVHIEQQGRRA